MYRRKTKKIYVGDVAIGASSDISIQSMTNTVTSDVDSTVSQILEFEKNGCDISRSAITCLEDAKAIPEIKKRTHIPFVADIQFDYKLALLAIEYGCDCVRINPGNIGGIDKLREIVEACKKKNISMRVGVNSGSLKQDMIDKYKGVNANSIVYSALEYIKMIENMGFYDMKVSLKSSDVLTSIESYKKFSSLSDYPLHLGITEAGPEFSGAIKSSIGIGSLLAMGIGDTIRVSITGDPVIELKIAREILKDLGLRKEGVSLISCPSCARTKIDLFSIVNEVEKRIQDMDKDIKVAVMGCPVNGPGEAKNADIGIAGNKGFGVIFKKGKVYKQVKEEDLVDELFKEIEKL